MNNLAAWLLVAAILLHPLIYLAAKDHQKRWHIEQCISFDETVDMDRAQYMNQDGILIEEKAMEYYEELTTHVRFVEELRTETDVHCLMAGLETKE